MKTHTLTAAIIVCAAALLGIPVAASAQSAPAAAAATPAIPADPWPRVVDLSKGQVLVYQPQVNKWVDNQIDFRAALAIKPTGAKEETFGVIFATARTQVDKVARTVVFENLRISKIDFPTLPDRGAAYAAELQTEFAKTIRTIALDRLQSSLALAGIKPPTVAVQNTPPQVFVSYSPAILVPIDGAPVLKPVPGDSRFKRVINTRALILQGGLEQNFYLHVYDGWMSAASIAGPWAQTFFKPVGMADAAQAIAKTGVVDMLDGGPDANPKPMLVNGAPAIYTSQTPTELIVFKGQPDFVPIVGTQLLWASNTTSDVLINTANNNYYALLAGRWFTSGNLAGPWTFVASDALPPDFARIPAHSLAGAVLPTVAGTPQAQEAVIENSIPQTATVPLKNGPKFTPNFDGPPQYAQIPGTPLSYVSNSSEPVIRVDANTYYAVTAGVWFTATGLTGPWAVATSVPAAIYAIPPSSPVYYVTYVRIYEATPQYVYVGYTPGYLGTVVAPYGTVVYGTGYVYAPWVGSVWYSDAVHLRGRRGAHLQPLRRLYVRLRDGPGHRRVDGTVLGRRLLPSRLLGRLRLLRFRERERLWPLGQHHVFRDALVVCGRRCRRHHGERELLQQPDGDFGQLQRRAPVQRVHRKCDARLRPHREWRRGRDRRRRAREQLQHLHRPEVDRQCGFGHDRRRELVQPRRGDDRGTRRRRACRRRLDVQREDRADQYLGHRERRQQSLRRRQRQRLSQRRQRLAAAFGQRLERRVGRFVVGGQGVAGAQHR